MDMDRQIEEILPKLKSKNVEKRWYALTVLQTLIDYDEEKEVSHSILNRMIQLAGKAFPKPIDESDDPSYFLIKFVSQFRQERFIDDYARLFFVVRSHVTKNLLLHILCDLGIDKGFQTFLGLYEEIKSESSYFPFHELVENREWVGIFLTHYLDEFQKHYHANEILRMHLLSLEKGWDIPSQNGTIKTWIHEQFQKMESEYKSYDNDYDLCFVYHHWYEKFPTIRNKIVLYLNLMEYYFDPKSEELVRRALNYRDAYIKTQACLTLIQHDHTIESEIMEQCAISLETTTFFYAQLIKRKKEHLFPIKEDGQPFFAKNQLFHHVLQDEEGGFVIEEPNVITFVNATNYYDQRTRWYLLSFKSSMTELKEDEVMSAWVGPFMIEENDDNYFMYQGTMASYEPFVKQNIELVKTDFLKELELLREEHKQIVLYLIESSTKQSSLSFKTWDFTLKTKDAETTIDYTTLHRVAIEKRKCSGSLFKQNCLVFYNESSEILAFMPLSGYDVENIKETLIELTEPLSSSIIFENI